MLTSDDTAPILVIRDLEKRYGAVTALDGINLSIRRGSIYGFIGPNGAGKTTTIRIIAGLVRPTGGSVTLQGHDLAGDRLAAAEGLRTLVEVPAFYPSLTGRENLAIARQILVGVLEAGLQRRPVHRGAIVSERLPGQFCLFRSNRESRRFTILADPYVHPRSPAPSVRTSKPSWVTR